jgi:hypothetical protein
MEIPMKKNSILFVAALAILTALSACTMLSPMSNILGTWEATILGVTTTYVFSADGIGARTVSILGVGVLTNGTWNADSTTLSALWDDSAENDVYSYSFNADKSTMTLAPENGGLSRTFTRL